MVEPPGLDRLSSRAARSSVELVRADCVERLDEVERATPTLVLVAKDAADNDLSDVRVSLDGAPLADRLDGTALSVEPGEHIFELRTPGAAPVSKSLVVREGEKGRRELVTFAPAARPESAAPAVDPGARAPAPPTPARQAALDSTRARDAQDTSGENGTSQRTIAYVVGGVGVVGMGIGTYFGLRSKSSYDDAVAQHCPHGLSGTW